MDTKWKNIRYSKFSKGITFILAVAFLTGALSLTVYLMTAADEYWDAAFEKSYMESNSIRYKLDSTTSDVTSLIKNYKNEEFIKSGATLHNNASSYYNRYRYSHELRRLFETFKNE